MVRTIFQLSCPSGTVKLYVLVPVGPAKLCLLVLEEPASLNFGVPKTLVKGVPKNPFQKMYVEKAKSMFNPLFSLWLSWLGTLKTSQNITKIPPKHPQVQKNTRQNIPQSPPNTSQRQIQKIYKCQLFNRGIGVNPSGPAKTSQKPFASQTCLHEKQ